MAKLKTQWVCSECGYSAGRWSGQCPSCRSWNTLTEMVAEEKKPSAVLLPSQVTDIRNVSAEEGERYSSGIGEFDRVLGGGVLPGAVVLAGGEPGVGKSTLFLQAAQKLSQYGPVLYVSGEESAAQIKVRASRIGVDSGVLIMTETELSRIVAGIEQTRPQFLIVDSVQTLYDQNLPSAPGSVTQVRGAAATLAKLAKAEGIATFIIGHVTKEGSLAGPRILEHIVDTVLYFESERSSNIRVLRAVKNRFGGVDEIGLFEMRDNGMQEMKDSVFLFDSEGGNLDGCAIFCATQGARPMLLEIQALCAQSQLNVPRRMAAGIDSNRLYMLCAVMEKKMGFKMYASDVFVNVAGGIRVKEYASDLGLAAAIFSSLRSLPIPRDTAFIGEVGLSGEIRRVSQTERRLQECARMGIRRVFIPKQDAAKLKIPENLSVVPVGSLFECFEKIA